MRKFILVLTLLVLLNVAWGYVPDEKEITSSNTVTRSELLEKNINNNSITVQEGTSIPNDGRHTKVIRGSFDLDSNTISLTQESMDTRVRSFLSNNVNQFGIQTENLALFSSYIGNDQEEQSILKYIQEYKGMKVYSSKVIVAVNNNKASTIKYDYYPGIDISPQPTLGEGEILNIVEADLGIHIVSGQKSFNIQEIQEKPANGREKVTKLEGSSLLIYPEHTDSGVNYHLAYNIELELIDSPPSKWVYIVDANNGAILNKYNKVVFTTLGGKITGSIFPEGPGQSQVLKNFKNETLYNSTNYLSNTFSSGTGNNLINNIVTKNPVDLTGVTSATLEFTTKYFIEKGYDFGYVTYSLDGQNFSVLEYYSGNKSNWSTRRISLSDLIGRQVWIGFFYETDSIVSYNGWFLDNITIQTSSGTRFIDNADTFTNWNNNGFSVVSQNLENRIALGRSGINGTYNLTGLPGSFRLYNEFSGPFVDIFNLLGNDQYYSTIINTPATQDINWSIYDSSYKREQSNVFYHVNVVHDFFTKGSPLDIYKMNYQMMADVQFPPFAPGECNAFADGTNLHFFGAGTGCDATSLFSDVIYHEYTHNVVDHVYTTYLPYIKESGALNEGWADYFASTINGNPCMAEGFYGDCLRHLNNTYRYPEDILGEVHDDSRIVAGASWDLRQSVGSGVSDSLVINAMKLEPFNFSEYLEDVIFADDNNSNLVDGTPHLFEICTAFFNNHGIYSSYCDRYYPVKKATNLLLNPGFEKGNFDWIQNSIGGYNIIYNNAYGSHYGSWFAYMGGYNNADDSISQDITIPADANQPFVQFWYWIMTEETTTTNPYDKMAVEIRKTDDTLLKTLGTLSNLDQSYGYVISPKYDVSEFKGQKIRFKFHSTTDAGGLTAFLVDDTGLFVMEKSSSGITFIPPTPANNSMVRKNWISVNVSADENLNTALLEWNGVNETMVGGGTNWHMDKTGLADGVYNFRVFGQNNSGYWIKSEMRNVNLSTVPSVLIINDDNDIYFTDDLSISIFRSAFEGLGYKVKIENATETSNLTWNNHDILVWSTGDDLTPINIAQYKSMLVSYVNNGGHLLLESGNIAAYLKQYGGQAIDADFRTKVLHITSDWVYSDVGDLTLKNSHPISSGLPDTIGFTPDKPDDNSGDADAVRILPDATGVYNWSYINYGGAPIDESIAKLLFGLVAFDDDPNVANGGQIVYFAFDVDDIDDANLQQTLISNAEKWLGSRPILQLNVTITESPDPVGSGNTSTVTVTVTSGGAAVSGASVTVSKTGGSLSPTSGTTDASGKFISTYTAPTVNATTNYTISAMASKTGYTSGSGSDIITVTLQACYAPWDVNQDGKVNVQDLAIVGQHFGQIVDPPGLERWDVNGDGKVNVQDLVIVGQHFGQTTCYAQ